MPGILARTRGRVGLAERWPYCLRVRTSRTNSATRKKRQGLRRTGRSSSLRAESLDGLRAGKRSEGGKGLDG